MGIPLGVIQLLVTMGSVSLRTDLDISSAPGQGGVFQPGIRFLFRKAFRPVRLFIRSMNQSDPWKMH
jgi:hypothetical protein